MAAPQTTPAQLAVDHQGCRSVWVSGRGWSPMGCSCPEPPRCFAYARASSELREGDRGSVATSADDRVTCGAASHLICLPGGRAEGMDEHIAAAGPIVSLLDVDRERGRGVRTDRESAPTRCSSRRRLLP